MKLLIADDHPLIIKGLSYFLLQEFNFLKIYSVNNGVQLIQFLKDNNVDILILDIDFPNIESFTFAKESKALYNNLKIIIYTQYSESTIGAKYYNAGIDGFVEKSTDIINLINAIKEINQGNKYFAETTIIDAKNIEKKDTNNPFDLLSKREMDVVMHLIKGNNYKTIANNLNLSASTVSTFKSRIYEKLNIVSNVEFFNCVDKYLKK